MDCGQTMSAFLTVMKLDPARTPAAALERLRTSVEDAEAGRRPPLTAAELDALAREIRPGADARVEVQSTEGGPMIVVRAVARATPGPALACLSPRELEVAQLVARGMSNAEIAARLGIRVGTVKVHVHRILQRLGARSRQRVVALVIADLERARRELG